MDLRNTDVDRKTGQTLIGWPAVAQSVHEIIRTPFGERVVREFVGSLAPNMIGRALTPERILRLRASIGAAIARFEPRFALKQARVTRLTADGSLSITLIGEYRPGALTGNIRSEGQQTLTATLA